MDANIQVIINSFRQLFPDMIFFLTFSKFPDISRQAVTLTSAQTRLLSAMNALNISYNLKVKLTKKK